MENKLVMDYALRNFRKSIGVAEWETKIVKNFRQNLTEAHGLASQGGNMPKSIRFQKAGGPEVLQLEEVAVGEPGPGEARVLHKACGVNFLDVYQRSGLYKMPLPSGAGNEGSGDR